jgi:hypothetical protein
MFGPTMGVSFRETSLVDFTEASKTTRSFVVTLESACIGK